MVLIVHNKNIINKIVVTEIQQLIFLRSRYKYHHDNKEYATNNLECIGSLILDKDINDKSSDRKCKLKNTRLRRMNILDASIIHRRAENSREKCDSGNNRELIGIKGHLLAHIKTKQRREPKGYDAEYSNHPQAKSCHRTSLVSLMR